MILAAIDPGKAGSVPIFFRGQPLEFWLSRQFRKIPFQPLKKPDREFDWLTIFDPTKFAAIDSQGINRFIKFLYRQANRETIYTLMGFPFFAVSTDGINGFKLRIEEGICRQVAKLKPALIDTLEDIPVWDVSSQSLEVEKFVVNYQVSLFKHHQVRLDDFRNFFIEGQVKIGRGTRIGSGVIVRGESEIGKNVHLYPHSYIENTIIEDDCVVLPFCVLRDSHLEKNVQVGPCTHLRNRAVIRKGAKAGNFVEIKKSVLGRGSKSMHLSYIGDASIGENVNIGAGTITCNYDGREKHATRIEDNVFIGSGTELIAPIRIGKNSVVGAGSTLDLDVPDDSLAIARERQVNKPGWIKKKKSKKKRNR